MEIYFEGISDVATKVQRADIQSIITRWVLKKIYTLDTNLNDISREHLIHLASNLRIRPNHSVDWRMFADVYGYDCERINRIHSLARNEIKTLTHIVEHHGGRNIKVITDVGKKFNINNHSLISIKKLICNIVDRKYQKNLCRAAPL